MGLEEKESLLHDGVGSNHRTDKPVPWLDLLHKACTVRVGCAT